jgi:TrmH family RNA methyltransferase
MGAIFQVPVARWEGEPLPRSPPCDRARRSGGRAPARPVIERGTLVVGAERTGLPDHVVAGCDRVAHLPIARKQASP